MGRGGGKVFFMDKTTFLDFLSCFMQHCWTIEEVVISDATVNDTDSHESQPIVKLKGSQKLRK